MLFMLVSLAKPGTKREQLVDRLTHEMHPETWDLVRHGELSHIYYKIVTAQVGWGWQAGRL